MMSTVVITVTTDDESSGNEAVARVVIVDAEGTKHMRPVLEIGEQYNTLMDAVDAIIEEPEEFVR